MVPKSFIFPVVKILSFTTILKLLASLITPDSIFKIHGENTRQVIEKCQQKAKNPYICKSNTHLFFQLPTLFITVLVY